MTSGSTCRRRQARDEPDDQPADHEHDRIGHAGAQAEPGQDDDGEQQEDEQLDLGHAIIEAVEHVVDARGLRCPLPLIRARAALLALAPGRHAGRARRPIREAPIDLAALAAGHRPRVRRSDGERLVLAPAEQ